MRLTLLTPARLLVEATVVGVRAWDETGSFQLLPGHEPFLTVLTPSILRWTLPDGSTRLAAVQGGVLRAERDAVHVLTPQTVLGAPGGDALALQAAITQQLATQQAQERRARAVVARFEAEALRELAAVTRTSGAW